MTENSGASELPARKWPSNGDVSSMQQLTCQMENVALLNMPSVTTSSTSTLPKTSCLKGGVMKKPGVTFDEKLEVYEVKNPHYGLEIKTEKRDMKRRKRERMREEDVVREAWYKIKKSVADRNNIPYFVKITILI